MLIKFVKFVLLAGLMTGLLVTLVTFRELDRETMLETRGSLSQTCGKFLQGSEIIMEKEIWQTFDMAPNISMKLLRAYVDDRRNRTVVRISSIGSQLNYSNDEIYCQLWYEGDSDPKVVKSLAFDYIWYKKWWEGKWAIPPDNVVPILIECPFDSENPPFSVSLTAQPCDGATNNLKVIDNNPENGIKKKFGVCSKSIYFETEETSLILKFIEWVELVRILGAEQIHLYSEQMHPSFQKVFDELHKLGRVDVLNFRKPKNLEKLEYNVYGIQLFLLEVLLLTDCFYRTRKLYDFIAFIDPDEVIMPVRDDDKTWSDLLRNFEPIDRNYYHAVSAVNVYFPPNNATPYSNIPKYHYMLQNNQRCDFPANKKPIKSFILPENVFTLAQHTPRTCFDVTKCKRIKMPTNISQLNHYRNKMQWVDDPETILDKTMEKYQTSLVDAVKKTLNEINFIP